MNIRGYITIIFCASLALPSEHALSVITPVAADAPTHVSVTADGNVFHILSTNVRDLSFRPAQPCTGDVVVYIRGDAVPVERIAFLGALGSNTLYLYDFGLRTKAAMPRTDAPVTNASLPADGAPVQAAVNTAAAPMGTNAEPAMAIAGRITDGEASSSATVSVYRVSDDGLTPVVKDKRVDGAFSIDVPSGGEYSIIARGTNGSISSRDVTVSSSNALGGDIPVRALMAGESITFRTILFDTDKWSIRAASFPVLDEIAAFLTQQNSVSIEIAGHTDDRAAADYNQRLSVKRAESIRSYLMAKGILRERMTAKGYGASKPVADNATPRGKYLNRRVEFVILTR